MKKSSISEIIFSMMLFLMFVIGGFLMVSYAGNIYKHIIDEGNNREAIQIPLSYLSEKLHQAKSNEYVKIDTLDGVNVLIIDNDAYYTCIYSDDNYLKELNINSIDDFNKDNGTSIYEVEELSMNYTNNLYEFNIVNNGVSDSITLRLR